MKGKNKFLLYLLCAVLVTFTGLTKVSAEGGYFEEFYTIFKKEVANDGSILGNGSLSISEITDDKVEIFLPFCGEGGEACAQETIGEIQYNNGFLYYITNNTNANLIVSKLIIRSVLKMKNLPDSYLETIIEDKEGKKLNVDDNGVFYKTLTCTSENSCTPSDITIKLDLRNGIKLPVPTPTPAPTPTPKPDDEPNSSTGLGYFEQFYTVFHEVAANDGKLYENDYEISYLGMNEPKDGKIKLIENIHSIAGGTGENGCSLGEITYADGVISYIVDKECSTTVNETIVKIIVKSVLKMKNLPDSYLEKIMEDKEGKNFSLNDNGIFIKTSTCVDGTGCSIDGINLKIDLCNGIKLPEPEPTPKPTPTPTPKPVTEPNPSTGVGYGIGVVVTIIALGTVAYITIYKKNKFPQV